MSGFFGSKNGGLFWHIQNIFLSRWEGRGGAVERINHTNNSNTIETAKERGTNGDGMSSFGSVSKAVNVCGECAVCMR